MGIISCTKFFGILGTRGRFPTLKNIPYLWSAQPGFVNGANSIKRAVVHANACVRRMRSGLYFVLKGPLVVPHTKTPRALDPERPRKLRAHFVCPERSAFQIHTGLLAPVSYGTAAQLWRNPIHELAPF